MGFNVNLNLLIDKQIFPRVAPVACWADFLIPINTFSKNQVYKTVILILIFNC